MPGPSPTWRRPFLGTKAAVPGLGWEFDAELEATLDLLLHAPYAAPVVHRDVRRALLHRFPYAVYYTTTSAMLEVRAVVDLRRHPAHWQRRV